MRQPNKGLWTSTPDTERDNFWVTKFANTTPMDSLHGRWGWKAGKTFRCWLLYPSRSARVATIDSLADLMRLGRKYGWHVGYWDWPSPPLGIVQTVGPVHTLNFLSLAKHFDALHLTDRGVQQAESKAAGKYRLAFWHAESTCWFRWCFDRVKELGPLSEHVKNPERRMLDLMPDVMRSYPP